METERIIRTMGTSRAWRDVIVAANRRGGVITCRQVVELGVPLSSLNARVRDEGWARPHRGVVALPGVTVDPGLLARSALLSVGPPAVLTGRTALALHGVVDRWPPAPHLLLPAAIHRTTQRRMRLTRSRTIERRDVTTRRGLPVASVARAFLDVAADSDVPRLRQWLIDGRQRRLVDVATVAGRAARTVRVHGRGRLLQACDEVLGTGADSALVAGVERWLRSEGIGFDVPPRTVPVRDRVLHPDLTVVGVPIAIEVDGFGAHASRHALDVDQRKHNAYALAGWLVLRIGWDRFTDDRTGFLVELTQAIADRSN